MNAYKQNLIFIEKGLSVKAYAFMDDQNTRRYMEDSKLNYNILPW